jgi:hypothetical protein
MRYCEFSVLFESYDEDQAIIKIANIAAKFLANEIIKSQTKKKYPLKDIPQIENSKFPKVVQGLIDQAKISLVQKIKRSKEIQGTVDFNDYHIKLKIPQFGKDELKLNSETNRLYYPELEIRLRRVLVHELAHILDVLKSPYHLKDPNKPYLQDPIEIGARIRQGMDLISFKIDEMIESNRSMNDQELFKELKQRLPTLIKEIVISHRLYNPHFYNKRQRRVYKKKYQHVKSRLYAHAVKYLEQKTKEQFKNGVDFENL